MRMLRWDLDLLLSVTTHLGTPLSVTAATPSVVPQPASASEPSYEVFVKAFGNTLTFEVYGSTNVKTLKEMVQEADGKGLGTACKATCLVGGR